MKSKEKSGSSGPPHPLLESLAGILGQFFASTVTYPLNVVKTRSQTMVTSFDGGDGRLLLPKDHHHASSGLVSVLRLILSESGWRGLFVGIAGEYVKEGVKMFVFFFALSSLKSKARQLLLQNKKKDEEAQQQPQQLPWVAETLCGMIAGCCALTFTTPLSVAHIRIQAGKSESSGFLRTIFGIYRSGGVGELYKGAVSSMIMCVYPAIKFAIADRVKSAGQKLKWKHLLKKSSCGKSCESHQPDDEDHLVARPNVPRSWCDVVLSAPEAFLVGAIAQFTANVLIYPLIRSRIVLQSGVCPPDKQNIFGVMFFLLQTEGMLGCYKGIDSTLIQTILDGSLQWLGKEKVQEFLVGASSRRASAKYSQRGRAYTRTF